MTDTLIPAPSTLVPGWYYHQDSQGRRVHAIRTLPGNDTHYITLCGQDWLRDSTKTDLNIPSDWKCHRCLKAMPRWEAK